MSANIVYTQAGSDPATIVWPASGPPNERWSFTSGTPFVVADLVGSGNGNIHFADGRRFAPQTPQGSTFTHRLGVVL